MNRREKERVVSELHQKLQNIRAVILTDYRGLNVEEITRLRRQLQEASVEYRVVKNTLMRLASKGTGLEGLSDFFVGPTAMAVSNDDPLAPARVLLEFSKETPLLEIRGGLIEGRVVGPREIEGIAKLPRREVLLGNLLRVLVGGQFRLVNTLSSHIRRVVQVLEVIRIARQGKEEAKAKVEVKEGAEEEAKVEAKEGVEKEAKAEVEVKEGAEEEAKAEGEVKEEAEEKVKAEVEVKEEVEEEAKAEVEVKEEAEEKVKAEVEVKKEVEKKAKKEAKKEVKKEPKKKQA